MSGDRDASSDGVRKCPDGAKRKGPFVKNVNSSVLTSVESLRENAQVLTMLARASYIGKVPRKKLFYSVFWGLEMLCIQ